MSDAARLGSAPNAKGWPALPAGALEGVRTRRFLAFLFDFVLVGVVAFFAWLALTVLTLGLSLLLLPPMFPTVGLIYEALTVGGRHRATWGMRLTGLDARLAADHARPTHVHAALHAVLLWLSLGFPPVFALSFFEREKRCLHDILSGIVIARAD
ncbi:MAG: RDD family protein [Hyphomicrobiales bacterium]|nr:RDD family protein [Hyphomicrobiales bacterium]MDE2016189.1 RDD family protein [Hyphomicrobiales bacterium]